MPGWPSSRPRKARRKRRYNVRAMRATWPYTVQEIAELLGVHKNAVLRWLGDGLSADRSQRPFLIRGDELIRFLKQRQDGGRHKCRPEEFYCFRCRVPREACLGIVDIVIESATRLRLQALCAVCETTMNKVQNVSELPKIRNRFHVQQLAGEHLIERAGPSLNSDLEK
jgi:excisionase family DNA binding protein